MLVHTTLACGVDVGYSYQKHFRYFTRTSAVTVDCLLSTVPHSVEYLLTSCIKTTDQSAEPPVHI